MLENFIRLKLLLIAKPKRISHIEREIEQRRDNQKENNRLYSKKKSLGVHAVEQDLQETLMNDQRQYPESFILLVPVNCYLAS